MAGAVGVQLPAFAQEPLACGWRESPNLTKAGPFPSGSLGLTGNPPPGSPGLQAWSPFGPVVL